MRKITNLVAFSLVLFFGACNVGAKDTLTAAQHERIEKMASEYNGKIRYGASFIALDPNSKASFLGQNAPFNPADSYSGLPHAAGYEEVFMNCSSCHSLQLVMTQNKNAQGWNTIVDTMVKERGMFPPEADTRAKIVAFLSTYYGASAAPADLPKQTPSK
ncbi:MAG: hypothetical protein FD163_2333 [Hyphomonadaceae bacterium]|nr:MAG: hypothetical protein FD128_2080 [Hyphomonadaceae bacterium]KAF0183613.1 MAG: hypothetical protein FD163_2333 [Hyphomonadaceae bacterium]